MEPMGDLSFDDITTSLDPHLSPWRRRFMQPDPPWSCARSRNRAWFYSFNNMRGNHIWTVFCSTNFKLRKGREYFNSNNSAHSKKKKKGRINSWHTELRLKIRCFYTQVFVQAAPFSGKKKREMCVKHKTIAFGFHLEQLAPGSPSL